MCDFQTKIVLYPFNPAENRPSFLPHQGDFFAGFPFVGIHYLDIPLGGRNTFVRHDALDGADVCPGCRLQRRKCSAIGVEGDVLGDTRRADPLLHVGLGPAALQSLEDHSPLVGAVADQIQRLLADGDDVLGTVLLGDDVYALAAGRVVHDVLPTEGEDVADAQAGHAGEERCRLQHGLLARCLGQLVELVHRKIILDHILRFNLI